MADIICRWRNATPKTVCDLVCVLPKEEMPSERFRDIMERQEVFSDFFHTAYQLACQLALYCEEDDTYRPRFHHVISQDEARDYLSHWIRWYYAPNPYTKSLKITDTPKFLVASLVDYVNDNGASHIEVALESIFKDKMGNLDIVINAINNYSQVLRVSTDKIISFTENYENYMSDLPHRNDKLSFFENFNLRIQNEKCYFKSDLPLQQIFYGAPGTGKSFSIDRIADDNNSIRTTFHPDSDYASFVGAYKPTMEEVPMSKTFTSSKEGTYAEYVQKTDSHPGTERKIVYKYVPQAFLKTYVEAWKDLENPHFLIIEEINRGNCAQIFGDLFQLLDRNSQGASSYAIHADEDIRQFLSSDEKGFANLSEGQKEAIEGFVLEKDGGQHKAIGDKILLGEMLLLPPNLHIWATMNTSDQSLFPIDSAFKRRWDWKYTPIDYNPKDREINEPLDWKFQIGDSLYSWGEFLKIINKEIYELTSSEDKQMGYFFAKADKNTGIISKDVFINKVLFYLWMDVFKDYDASSEIFKNKKENRSFRFTDFFQDEEAIENFIGNLNLNEVSIPKESEDIQVSDVENQEVGKYLVNDVPVKRQNAVAAEAIRAYINQYPDKSAAEVVSDWKGLGQIVSYFVQTEDEHNLRTDSRKDYVIMIDCHGENIYVSKEGWGDNRPNGSFYALLNLVNAIKAKEWNIEISGVK